MDIQIIEDKIDPHRLQQLTEVWFKSFVKIAVDIERRRIAVGGELHADGEAQLLVTGSVQDHIWGANFYSFQPPDERLEYTALINIRPRNNNPGMEIMNPAIRNAVKTLVEKLLLHPDETLSQGEGKS